MPTLTLCLDEQAMTGGGVDDLRLDDDLTVTDEFTDVGAGVGGLDLGLLCGVEPDLAPADA